MDICYCDGGYIAAHDFRGCGRVRRGFRRAWSWVRGWIRKVDHWERWEGREIRIIEVREAGDVREVRVSGVVINAVLGFVVDDTVGLTVVDFGCRGGMVDGFYGGRFVFAVTVEEEWGGGDGGKKGGEEEEGEEEQCSCMHCGLNGVV